MSRFRRLAGALCLLVTTQLIVGCGGDDNSPVVDAHLRVVHASPDAPNVDVLVDNTVVLSNVPYPSASNYLALAPGSHNIKVNAAGTTTTVINTSPSLTPGTSYTVLAVGFLSSIQPLVAVDDTARPASGSAKLRVIHAAPDAGNVDVLVNNSVVLSNVPFEAISNYLVVPAGTYDVKVNAAGTSTTAIETSVTLASGDIYSAVAIGSVKTAATHPLALELLTDL